MTLIIMLGLYFIVVTKVEQQLLPNRPGKRSYMALILVLFNMSKRTPPVIKDLIVELSKKGKYVS